MESTRSDEPPKTRRGSGNVTNKILPFCLGDPRRLLWLEFFPFAKNCRADPHAGRPLFNCDLKIVRHSHGENLHTHSRQAPSQNPVAQLSQLTKIRPRLLRIIEERWDGHE